LPLPGEGCFCSPNRGFLQGIDTLKDHMADMLRLIWFILFGRLYFPELIFGSITEEFPEVTFVE